MMLWKAWVKWQMVILIIKTFARITDIMKMEAPPVDTRTTQLLRGHLRRGFRKIVRARVPGILL